MSCRFLVNAHRECSYNKKRKMLFISQLEAKGVIFTWIIQRRTLARFCHSLWFFPSWSGWRWIQLIRDHRLMMMMLICSWHSWSYSWKYQLVNTILRPLSKRELLFLFSSRIHRLRLISLVMDSNWADLGTISISRVLTASGFPS